MSLYEKHINFDEIAIEEAFNYLEPHTLNGIWGEDIRWVKLKYNNGLGEEQYYKAFNPLLLIFNESTCKIEVKCKPNSGYYEDQMLFIGSMEDLPEFIEFKIPVLVVDENMNVLNYAKF